MKNKITCVLTVLCAGFFMLEAQKKVIPPPFKQIPPNKLIQCPDIAVASFTVRLESTQVGDSSVDLPHDTVRLRLELQSAGSLAVPAGTALHIVFKRNDEVVHTVDPVDALGAKGSRWAMGLSDSFPHGLKTTYSVAVTTSLQECTVRNNEATLDIDEAQLHRGGVPDLTCSMFTVEKRWKQVGDQFKGTCYFAADIYNKGSGYCQGNADLMFKLKKPNRDTAFSIPIKEKELPAPGYHKRISTEQPDSKFDFGDYAVSAKIWPAANEQNKANNESSNTCLLHNAEAPPVKNMAKISFPPWGMTARILTVRIKIQNLQQLPIANLRLILLKNNAVIKEWKSITLSPGATIQKSMTDDRPEVERGPDPEQYKAILTTNPSDPLPPESTILDAKTRPLWYLDLGQGLLQTLLQDETDGIGAQIEREHNDLTIHDNETLAQIYNQMLYIQLKGNKRLKGGAKVGFRASVYLKLHARNGKLEADIVKKDIEVGSKLSEAFLTILMPGIYQGIKYGIEKSAEKALGSSMSLGNFGGYSPCGVFLGEGYMNLYYPYST